ncbi:MerR family transcriptional regulator [Secundilactobacillus folii]|nr:MerR family transcriptional regulator [Secundilactobacillus folii]
MINQPKKELAVKDVAQLLNISAYTVRYYTDQGLVPSVQRNINNQRVFNQDAVNWLRADLCLRETGMTIAHLREYVNMCLEGEDTIPDRYQIILAQQREAQKQLTAAQERVDYLARKVKMYQEDLNDHNDRLNPETWPVE